MKSNINSNLESGFFINILLKNYKLLIWVCLITIVLSSFFTSPIFITPKYKSQLVMFPTSSNSISKALLTDQVSVKQDILQYGEDEQIDQMLQVLNSNKIRDRVIEKFDLLEHYGFEKSSYKVTKLNKAYNENIKFRRTEFMAVSVTVLDKDPQMAADIANEIAALYDSTCVMMQKERAAQAYKIVEQTYMSLVDNIQKMEDSLAVLRALGINDYETQSESINQQLAIQIANGKMSAVEELQKQLEVLAKYGTPYVSIRDQLDYDKRQLSLIKVKYEEAKIDAEEELTQKFIISEAFPAEKKSYPIRWLIVLISTLAVFLMTIIILTFADVFPSLLSTFKSVSKTQHMVLSEDQPQKIEKKKSVSDNKITYSDTKDNKEIKKFDNKNNNDMNNFFSTKKLWDVLWKRKYHIIILTIIGIVVGVIFSSPRFIVPKYKSVAVVYPSNISSYSDESESEQILQWFLSTDIKWQVIDKFNLYEHYGIEKGTPKSLTYILNEYNNSVKIELNSYDAVTITVFDKDPQMACDMVNAINDFLNQNIRKAHKEKFSEVVPIYEKTLEWAVDRTEVLTDEIIDLGTSNDVLSNIAKAFRINAKNSNVSQNEIGDFDSITPKYVNKLLYMYFLNQSHDKILDNYNIAYANMQKEFTYTNVLSHPYVADKKSTPIRWLIVLFTAIAFMLVSYIGFVIVENIPINKEKK